MNTFTQYVRNNKTTISYRKYDEDMAKGCVRSYIFFYFLIFLVLFLPIPVVSSSYAAECVGDTGVCGTICVMSEEYIWKCRTKRKYSVASLL